MVSDTRQKDTLVTHEGRQPSQHAGTVNMPVYRASTICFPTMAALDHARANPLTETTYGIYGTPTVKALERAVAKVEGGYRALAVGSGLAAISASILAFAGAGDHILMVDSVYGPTRKLCETALRRLAIETTYYDPLSNCDVAALIRPNTKLIYAESPGSHTFEMQDIPTLAAIAHDAGLPLLMDNSWGTPYHFAAFAHGVDVSIHAATKYISGHSDVMLGIISTNEKYFWPVREQIATMGFNASPDDCYLGLRGWRTIGVRMKQQAENAMKVATWLAQREEVAEVLYPALPGAPGHEIWRRDYTGAASLFGVVLKPCSQDAVNALVDNMDLFTIGASWGGFESLVLPSHPVPTRSVRAPRGPMVRLHIGLEDPEDLIADLAAGMDRLRKIATGHSNDDAGMQR